MGKVNIKQLNVAPASGYVIGSGAGGVPIWKLESSSVDWSNITGNQAVINLSGFTNDAGFITGNQTITLSGDVTGSGTTSISTTIANNAVTNAKFRQGAGASVVGVTGAAIANVADIISTSNTALRNIGGTLAFGQITGAIIAATGYSIPHGNGAGSLTESADLTYFGGLLTIGSGSVNASTGFRVNSLAPLGQYLRGNGTDFVSSALTSSDMSGAALSVLGRASNSSGALADITAGTDLHVLRRSGTSIGFGLLTGGSISATNDQVFYGAGGIAAQSSNFQYNGTLATIRGANQPLGGAFNTQGNLFVASNSAFAINTGGAISLGGIADAGGSYFTYGRIHGKKETAGDGSALGYLSFETDNNSSLIEAMRITSGRLVGIGTSTPLSRVGILGNVAIGATYANLAAPTSGLIVEGKVGINRSSPSAWLEVNAGNVTVFGGRTSSAIAIPNGAGATGNVSQIGLGFESTTYQPVAIAAITTSNVGNTHASLIFGTRQLTSDTAPLERMRITNTGQIGINQPSPVASAIVEIVSTTQGFMPPRMTATQASAIASPAEGLMIYVTNTNGTFTAKGWWGWEGSAWVILN